MIATGNSACDDQKSTSDMGDLQQQAGPYQCHSRVGDIPTLLLTTHLPDLGIS